MNMISNNDQRRYCSRIIENFSKIYRIKNRKNANNIIKYPTVTLLKITWSIQIGRFDQSLSNGK
ncbi:unnamed protein product [Brugia timori]|uniref:Uncharacterized protein n=1 Tax=Brugia timori TaxID=42155 RepID=A0A3P7U280_9BILA|nr:unnamed protein product [Brugia timori]